ncbi:ATP-binding cassette domain-containing protein, partial [Frankia sp. Cpl3]|nr:ATP-binding cassette domain-containing protein [Frankia sp. Cpl3]
SLRSGEILGIAGLMGAGRTELARVLFGADRFDQGKIYLEGKPVNIAKPKDAIDAGIALITEDRKGEGLILSQTVRENVALPNLNSLSSYRVMNR